MKWITRSHIQVDRVACPWLIRRFVDSDAVFLFVAPASVAEVAKQEGAIPFDIPGVELGHKGDLCSFDAIIEKYQLRDPALHKLAKIVNAADTPNVDRDPAGFGLKAIANGFSVIYPDDLKNIEKQFVVYDALYAFCRLEAAKNA